MLFLELNNFLEAYVVRSKTINHDMQQCKDKISNCVKRKASLMQGLNAFDQVLVPKVLILRQPIG